MYTPTIGLEIHAELLTESKLFCGCRNDPNEQQPNTHICPVCMGYPGALPFLNRKAVEHMLRIGTALGGELATYTAFDRKHYFYPDIPKGYQISQYPYPLVKNAELLGVFIERIHLEEDTAKSSHDVTDQGSVIDFNRSGVPLMELVTGPVIHDAEEARRFAEMLQLILRYLGVARARMEWGEMRVEANISVSTTGTPGTKAEVKNLNSFRALCGAILFEIERQTNLLESGENVVQETRGWNEHTGKTFSQRLKETSAEYRYMPEPDIPPCRIDQVPGWDEDSLRKTIPELPLQRKDRYIADFSLPEEQAERLVKHTAFADMFDYVAASVNHADAPRLAANYLLSDVMRYSESKGDALFANLTEDAMAELIGLITTGTISSRGAKDIIAIIVERGGSPRAVAQEENLFQQSDEGVLSEAVAAVAARHGDVADEYRAGKERALQFLVGQVMKETKGSANPAKVQELLKKKLM